MRRKYAGVVLALALTATAVGWAESKNVADYPLRLHIFGRNETNFYHNRAMDEAKGEGRANLFENGEARAVDFNFECSQKIKASFGYETYPAKWKKPGRELTVLFPEFGKAGSYFTCNINVDEKGFAYAVHDGRVESLPVADYKKWMVNHDYDPEHGKDLPTRNPPAGQGNAPAGAAQGHQ